ncbi:MAG: hypothetical protein ACE5PM_08720 [Candidatus Hydrothermarchaeales archaeon]
MSGTSTAFDEEVVRNIVKTRDLLEELLETIDILADEELMIAIKESEKEVEEGKTRPFREFVKEMGLENDL